MGNDNIDSTNNNPEEYSSYDDYLKSARTMAEGAAGESITDQIQETVSDSASGSDAGTSNLTSPSQPAEYGQHSYSTYSDYLNSMDEDGNDMGAGDNDFSVEGDQAGTNTGDGVPGDTMASEDATGGSGASLADGGTGGASGQDLLKDGGEFGASGFSDVNESVLGRAGGLLNTAKNGIGNAIGGTVGSVVSGIKNLFGKGKSGIQHAADKLHVPFAAAATMAGVVGGGGILTIWSLFAGGNSIIKYSDISNCNRKEMIDEYVADHGAGDDWTEESAKGNAAQIYQVLSSPEPWMFDSMAWNGSKWEPVKVINDGFGFSDEAIAGMLANAYAESKIRSDCFEMDYLVHDIDTKNDDDSYRYEFDADTDFVLGRTHHSNWNGYVERMFELYDGGADGQGGMVGHVNLNHDAYKWRSDYTGPGAVRGDGQVGSTIGNGYYTNRDTTVLQEGLMPGFGLWQWTGQRAWNMGEFADVQADPEDKNQDGRNDAFETVDLQLAFLYYENWGDFSEYGVSDKDTITEYTLKGKEAISLYKNMSDPARAASYSGFTVLSQHIDEANPDSSYMKVKVKFKKTGNGVLAWGRQSKYKYDGKITSHGEVKKDVKSYKTLSYDIKNDKDDRLHEKSEAIDGYIGDAMGDDKIGYIDATRDMYGGQKKATLDHEKDYYDDTDEDTTTSYPKVDAAVGSDNEDGAVYIVGDTVGDEVLPVDFLSDEWDDGYLKEHIVEEGPGSDNRVYQIDKVDEAEYNEYNGTGTTPYGPPKIFYPRLANIGTQRLDSERDHGWWHITAYDLKKSPDEEHPVEARYLNKAQSWKQPNEIGAENREGDIISMARIFANGDGALNDEMVMHEALYKTYPKYKKVEVQVDNADGSGTHTEYEYYRLTVLDLRKWDEITDPTLAKLKVKYDETFEPVYDAFGNITNLSEGTLEPIEVYRKAMEDPEGKYIVADLTLAAGAECATECALQFYNKWEGMEGHGSTKMLKNHLRKAGAYYILMKTSGWKANNAYAHSVLELIDHNRSNNAIRNMRLKYVNMGCEEEVHAPDTIAACAVAWAWPKGFEGDTNPGNGTTTQYYDWNLPYKPDGCWGCSKSTSLYVACHDAVIEGDGFYSSCDRAVCTAVRSAGADDNFPPGNASGCFSYCYGNPDKWENLGPIRSTAALEKLEPGDLLIAGKPGGGSGGHVVVFVGEDLPKEKWPSGAGAVQGGKYCCVHASHSSGTDSRGPRCDNDCQWIMSDSRVFYGFRCREYEASSEFKDLAQPFLDEKDAIFNGDGNSGRSIPPQNAGL